MNIILLTPSRRESLGGPPTEKACQQQHQLTSPGVESSRKWKVRKG